MFRGASALAFERGRGTLEGLSVLDWTVDEVHFVSILEHAADHRDSSCEGVDAESLAAGQPTTQEFLAILEEIIRTDIADEPAWTDESGKAFQDRAAVFEPPVPDLVCLGATELISKVVVTDLLDCRGLIR